jgi:hypothetical protein
MASIFISYRRDDTEGHAGRLLDELRKRLGKDSVFMDVEGISPGLDFRQVIQTRLASCEIMLALIGPRWLDARDASGGRRLENKEDVLRFEIATAIKRGITVVPVLMHGTRLPEGSELPDDLRPLLKRHAFEMRHDKWSSDVKLLMDKLGLPDALADHSRSQVTWVSLQVWVSSVVAIVVAYQVLYLTLNWNEAVLLLAWVALGLSLGAWHASRARVNLGRDVTLGFVIALSGAVAISIDGTLFYQQPFWPQTEPEWQYTVKHMVTIMLSFIVGSVMSLLIAKKGILST